MAYTMWYLVYGSKSEDSLGLLMILYDNTSLLSTLLLQLEGL